MITGYTRPLYLLPFDHRASYISGLFGWKEPLNAEQMATVADSKRVIYAGFQQALVDQVPKDRVGILVDEEFGAAILRDAAGKGYTTALSVEKSGQKEFEFAYGDDIAQHIEAFHPTFAKVLVRYNPEVGSRAYRTICTGHRRCSCSSCSCRLSRCSCNSLMGTRTPMTCGYAHA